MGLDFNFKTWKWTQWLALVGLIQMIWGMFRLVYVYINPISFRITLLLFGTLLVGLYNFLYVIGFFVNQEEKPFLIRMAIPLALILVDMLFFYFLKNAIKTLAVYYLNFIIFALHYLVYCGTLYLCYKKVEFTYEDLSQLELFELGVINEDPRRVIDGKAVENRGGR